ncbi:hypothetical protein JCM24511_01980 [Saitozyma sp. JCM 24511]|nr:hypothetical protein JCM24511_01980 [Saitozyma sp. JCM 24511]
MTNGITPRPSQTSTSTSTPTPSSSSPPSTSSVTPTTREPDPRPSSSSSHTPLRARSRSAQPVEIDEEAHAHADLNLNLDLDHIEDTDAQLNQSPPSYTLLPSHHAQHPPPPPPPPSLTNPPPWQSDRSRSAMADEPPLARSAGVSVSTTTTTTPTPARSINPSPSPFPPSAPSSSSRLPDPSSAVPSATPGPSSMQRRAWRPTPDLPADLAQRHRRAERGRNHWLSEDEGLGGSSSKAIGRRRRRGSGGDHAGRRGGDDDDDDYGGDDDDDAGGRPGASFSSRRDKTTDSIKALRLGSPDSTLPSRHPRRRGSGSIDGTSTSAAQVHPPSELPRIEHLVAPPSPVTATVATVGIGGIAPIPDTSSIPAESFSSASAAQRPLVQPIGTVPLGAGDGLEDDEEDDEEDEARKRAWRRDLVRKLKPLFNCVFCPGTDRLLHHPLTLPCGHTLSSEHLYIPSPAPIPLGVQLPHELYAAQQRQHQQRLNLWAGVMCPIPSCKRYSPHAGTSQVVDPQTHQAFVPIPGSSAGTAATTLRGEVLSSGVTYYPPTPIAPPAYSAEPPVTETGSPLLDVTVDKVMALVLRELDTADEEDEREREREERGDWAGPGGGRSMEEYGPSAQVGGDTDDEGDDEDDQLPHTSLSQDLSLLGSGSIAGARSQRPRNVFGQGRQGPQSRYPHRAHRAHRTIAPVALPFEKELMGLLECDVCSMLLYEPVTTPCQHSFCLKCLSRSLDHSQRCPICRQDLPSFAFFQEHAVNKVLLTIIKLAFPDEYTDRRAAIERDERDARLDTPIFVCTLAFPGMPTILHVFEPRYRLMIRRCIESSTPRFGMVLPSRGTGPDHLQGVMEYGTMLEIQSVQMLPDGRSMVETVGSHRFRLMEKGSLDGYTVGRIERIDDISAEDEALLEQEAVRAAKTRAEQSSRGRAGSTLTPAPAATPPVNASAGAVERVVPSAASLGLGSEVSSGLAGPTAPTAASPGSVAPPGIAAGLGPPPGQSLGLGPAPGAPPGAPPTLPLAPGPPAPDETPHTTEELMAICRSFIDQLRSGSAPWLLQRLNNTYGTMPTDPSEFSYWMALVMPIDEYEKARLLPIRSPRLRLKLIVHWVESLRSSWWFSSG